MEHTRAPDWSTWHWPPCAGRTRQAALAAHSCFFPLFRRAPDLPFAVLCLFACSFDGIIGWQSEEALSVATRHGPRKRQ